MNIFNNVSISIAHRLNGGLWIWIMVLMACEDQITPTLEEADPVLAVDAWLTDQSEPQSIRLTRTQPYFETEMDPVRGAEVMVSSSSGDAYVFTEDEQEPGTYVWTPPAPDSTFGTVGETYELSIVTGDKSYVATSTMNPVPPVDSITYELQEAFAFFPETYIAEFWAQDLPEVGNAYWIRAEKNGVSLNDPDEISISYDGGFSQGGAVNGEIFIQPIRTSINPFEQDENDETLPAYELGDSVRVELLSISDEAYNFLNQVAIQTNRPGGFSELFATPLANVPTNLRNTNPEGPPAVGFFNVAAVSSRAARID